ncbi:MAG TPA: VOC family protein, partial [Gemmatimonadales bacterium]|nr:VOC family protein [Gemmatimonadales bacterium]
AVGGFELGLLPDAPPGAVGSVAYWGVPDAAAEYERLLGLGATPHETVKEVGGGIKVATVLDPFGNLFGVIENPHFRPEAVR